jgi:hypothetical protein
VKRRVLDAGLGRVPETTSRNKDRSKDRGPDMTAIYKSSEMEEGGKNSRTDNQRGGLHMGQEKATAVDRMW